MAYETSKPFPPGSICKDCGFSTHGLVHIQRCLIPSPTWRAPAPAVLCSFKYRGIHCDHRDGEGHAGMHTLYGRPVWPDRPPENRIVPADSPELPARLSYELPPFTPLGALIDRINQGLQVLMGQVDGNPQAETIIRVIAQELRQHYRDEYGGAADSNARFVAVGKGVMQGAEFCATARSHTFAKRIARALNRHKPTREGV